MATVAVSDAWVVPPPIPMHRFTVAQYHRMIETGVLTENDRVELLEGWIVDKMPQHPRHSGAISILQARLQARLRKGWIVRVQSPITLEGSEPEPDLAVVKGPEERYLTAHPKGEDIALVIEVADSSVDRDRTVKGRTYAEGRIPVFWLVNLPQFTIEVYSQPKGGRAPKYQSREVLGVEQGATLCIEGRSVGAAIPVAHLFPQ